MNEVRDFFDALVRLMDATDALLGVVVPVIALGAVAGLLYWLSFKAIATKKDRAETAASLKASALQSPLAFLAGAVLFISTLIFFGGLFLAALGYEPLFPGTSTRAWIVGLLGAFGGMVVLMLLGAT